MNSTCIHIFAYFNVIVVGANREKKDLHVEPIAIIGIGCRFPGGADDAESYWLLLRDGRTGIGEIPPERWSLDGFYDPRPDLPNRSYSKWGGFLSNIRNFDASFFGLSQREAEAMDPQQRLLLMTACEAASDAGLPLEELRRQKTGVFIGVSNVDYGFLQRYRSGQSDSHAGTGTALSIIANRISNRLDLPGPSMGIDTACSSSLVAVDAACRHLADGSCNIALAGGVNILLDPRMFITFSRARMLSPTGRIRAFDAAADGFVRGEGVGVVLLRRLDEAIAAGDRIYAVIDATAVNQDGRTGTITEPSRDAQAAMMQSAAEQAGISDIDYVEAHGTGTLVGDPIEASAIGTVFGKPQSEMPLLIGSVKTNIGHLEPAAGIAGLIKTALVVHHRHVPASRNFKDPNPAIDFEALGIAVVNRPQDLRDDALPLRALVNSFGFGGTNACVLLSSVQGQTSTSRDCVPIASATERPSEPHPVAVPLSAPTGPHLQHLAARFAAAIECGSLARCSVSEIAGAIAAQRDHDKHRAVIIATTSEQLHQRLLCLAEGREWPAEDRHAPPEIITGKAETGRKLVFTLTGQGGQWWSMGRELIAQSSVFRQTLEAFDRVFEEIGGWSVLDVLGADEADSRIHDAAVTPAVMFAFQAGLAALWRTRGVRPDMVLGHSFGEVTAAYLAGGLEFEAIARLVNQRGLIRGQVDRLGTMAAIGLAADTIKPLLPVDGSIEIGGYNSPDMVTLTGDEAAIDALIEKLNRDDPTVLTRKLALDFAYHSSWFSPVEEHFKTAVGKLETAPPTLPVISTVTGETNDRFDADYWWQNLRKPVLYQQAIERALELGGDTFIELGPHRTLSNMTAACAAAKGRSVKTVSTLDRRWGDLVSIAVATAQLYVSGVEVNWSAINGQGGRGISLPHQPWILRDVWREPEEAAQVMRPPPAHPLLGRSEVSPTPVWTTEIGLSTHPFLDDHRIDGACIFPAAAYVDMLTAAAREVLDCEAIELVDVTFAAALRIDADDSFQLRTQYDVTRRRLTINSRLRGSSGEWQLRAKATIYPLQKTTPVDLPNPTLPSHSIDAGEFYRTADENGFGWGAHFQGLQSISADCGEAVGEIGIEDHSDSAQQPFVLDPRALDCAFQLMLACDAEIGASRSVPVGIARVAVYGNLGRHCRATAKTRAGANGIVASVSITSNTGSPILHCNGIWVRRMHKAQNWSTRGGDKPRCYFETFEPVVEDAAPTIHDSTWLLFAAQNCSTSQRIANAFSAHGGTVEICSISAESGLDHHTYMEAIAGCAARTQLAGIIYAMPLHPLAEPRMDIAVAASDGVLRATAFGQALAKSVADEPLPPITVLTQNARVLEPQDAVSDASIIQSALLGLFRTISLEVPDLLLKLVDFDADTARDLSVLFDIVSRNSRETEYLVRSGRAYAARLGELDESDLIPSSIPLSKLDNARNFVLRHSGPPGPHGLRWQQAPQTSLGPDDVTVEVQAVGLNYRDVMAVSSALPEYAEPTPAIEALGLELSGVVIARGDNVKLLDIGDHVLGMGRGAFQRFVTWPAVSLQRAPPALSHIQAATIPSTFLTAHYALNYVARLQSVDSLLIHSATGGVGLAAIALARRAGARIIATAGSPQKREHLKALGIADVFDSRSLGFADDVLHATDGRGVDVVLNALEGPFIDKGLSCLASYGRFLELGKRDVYADSALGLGSLRSNISFHVIDLAALIADRPDYAAVMLDEVMSMLKANEIEVLPSSAFGASNIGDAFRFMSGAKHIGKVVVRIDDPETEIETGLADGAPLDSNGTYLVTGGTTGFGRAVGEWLAKRGAGRVVLASRRADTGEFEMSNTRIETLCLDVADTKSVVNQVASMTASDKPLRGIIHAAVVYEDALLQNMTRERISRVLAPKIDGALNLTRAVELSETKLDFFVSFASLAQVVGWAGQSNYAAANSFLEGLVHWQRARGIPGKCINWGALDESGHVARNKKMQSYLASTGWIGIDNETAIACLAKCLDSGLPTLTIAAADWRRLATTHPTLAQSHRTAGLVTAANDTTDALSCELAGLQGDDLEDAALRLVHTEAAKVLRTSADDIATCETLDDAGIDSLSTFELRLRIEQRLRLDVPITRYARASRFRDLAALARTLVEEARARRQ